MPCPHNEISIVQRSHRQSAVAAAAYQSGEKLFCEYDQEVKHYPEKRGIFSNGQAERLRRYSPLCYVAPILPAQPPLKVRYHALTAFPVSAFM